MRQYRITRTLWLCALGLTGAVATAGCNADGRTGGVKPGDQCNICSGNQYIPCDSSNKPGAPITCAAPKMCWNALGCVDCTPGKTACDGEVVRVCTGSGEFGQMMNMCDTAGGEKCAGGRCMTACEAASEEPTNQGCEFWAVDLDNEYSQFNDAAAAPWGVVLSNAGNVTAKVVIERNLAPPGQPPQLTTVKDVTVAPGSLQQISLPTSEVDGSVNGMDEGPGTWLSSRAFRITSSVPLVAYQFNPLKQTFSNDASLLIPTNGLGQVYRVLGYPTANPISGGFSIPGIPDHSFVTVVGTKPNTQVTVKLGAAIVGGGPVPARTKGQTVQLTIGPFDVLNLESDGIPGDLTGTLVQSTQPVAVFTGGERGISPVGVKNLPTPPDYDPKNLCCTDHLEDQLFPVTSLGKSFVITRSPIRSQGWSEPDILRFVGAAQAATVKTSLPAPDDQFTLQPGELRETWADKDIIVESSEPILIGQILVSQNYCYNPKWGGDPSLTIFPPVEQHRKDYLFLVPASWAANFLVIAAPVTTAISVDGNAPQGCVIAPAGTVGGVQYEARRCPIGEGAHRVTGAGPFGVTAYGYGPVGSYAFAGGAAVRKIYEPPPIQ